MTNCFDGEKKANPALILDGDRPAIVNWDETKVREQIKVPKSIDGLEFLEALAHDGRRIGTPAGHHGAAPVAESLKFDRLESEIHRLGVSFT